MNAAQGVAAGLELIRLGTELAAGKVTDALATAKRIMVIAVDLMPAKDLAPYLTERDRVWADLTVDIAEAIKLDREADAAEAAKVGP